jgi:hypothetical protein
VNSEANSLITVAVVATLQVPATSNTLNTGNLPATSNRKLNGALRRTKTGGREMGRLVRAEANTGVRPIMATPSVTLAQKWAYRVNIEAF